MPSAEHLIRIRETYGVDLNWLLVGEGQMIDRREPYGKSTVDHIRIARQFKNKKEAMHINEILKNMEDIDERQFFRVLGRLEAELEKLEHEADPSKKAKLAGN